MWHALSVYVVQICPHRPGESTHALPELYIGQSGRHEFLWPLRDTAAPALPAVWLRESSRVCLLRQVWDTSRRADVSSTPPASRPSSPNTPELHPAPLG